MERPDVSGDVSVQPLRSTLLRVPQVAVATVVVIRQGDDEMSEEILPTTPDWSGVHVLAANDGDSGYRCLCGRSAWPHADSVRTHIEWALREQNKALWNAGQRACNTEEFALDHLGRVLDACRPSAEAAKWLAERGLDLAGLSPQV